MSTFITYDKNDISSIVVWKIDSGEIKVSDFAICDYQDDFERYLELFHSRYPDAEFRSNLNMEECDA